MATIKKLKAGFKAKKAADGKTVYDEDYHGKYDEPAPKKQSFSDAFKAGRAAALKGGSKTFTWNGKSYGTDLKAPAAKSTARANPNGPESTSKVPAKLTDAEKAGIRKKVDQNTAVSSLNKLPSSVPTRPAYNKPGATMKKGGKVAKKCMKCGGKAKKK